MGYKQIKSANPNITYTGGWCLAAVQNAFNTDHPYPTAMAQWDAPGTKHYDTPPLGVDTPVFFSLKGEPAGHVAIQLANGTVASSSQAGTHKPMYIHANIAALISYYSSAYVTNYLGWKEIVGTQQVVQYVNDPAPTPDPTPQPSGFTVGDIVVPTTLVDYAGTPLTQWDDTYTISELIGDRAVLMARGQVWAAMNTANIQKV